jgi:hypothetical protein
MILSFDFDLRKWLFLWFSSLAGRMVLSWVAEVVRESTLLLFSSVMFGRMQVVRSSYHITCTEHAQNGPTWLLRLHLVCHLFGYLC